MKIVIDDNIPYIKGRLEPVADTLYVDQFGFTPENVRDADAIVIRTRTLCNESLLGHSRVRLIATATIGMDQIDIPWCAERGISVNSAPGCNAPGVAQYVWSALLREGFDPVRHTLGVVGCGNVGGIVAEWGRLLGTRVVVSDPPRQRAGIEDDYMPIDKLMAECDAVTLHTPLTRTGEDPTFHLADRAMFARMRPGALLVNAARGPVVDSGALLEELRAGRIRAVLDTWEGEPIVNKELLSLTDYGTFHIAGYSREGKQRATRMALEALEKGLGIVVDKSGLEGAYRPHKAISAEGIMASYDPGTDSDSLKAAPELFDTLRRNYDFRPEYRPEADTSSTCKTSS